MRKTITNWGERLPRPLEGFAREVGTLFDRFFGEGAGAMAFTPTTNVAENEVSYEVSMDLPGMRAEEVSVELKDDTLYVFGERKEDRIDEGKTYHRLERSCGKFRRSITLPGVVDAEKIDAQFKDGVLTIRLPKRPDVLPKQIKVNG